MKRKLRIAVLFGGKSAEHEVSILSARNVVRALDRRKYDIGTVCIDTKGVWKYAKESLLETGRRVEDIFGFLHTFDVVFPVLHGPFGEDGTVQGLLKLADVPFVGAGVLGSAVGMDKDVMKRLLRDAGIPIARFAVVHSHEKIRFADAKKKLGLPMFVKPANLGSSVGVSKVRNEKEFNAALRHAFEYDTKILVEEFVDGREIECSVLGNERPVASVPGELVLNSEFYSYEAKYLDPEAMIPQIPAHLPKKRVKEIQRMAVLVFKTLCCEGMARVDFFVTKLGKVLVNEINTIPGFTSISMYPKMWEEWGMPYPKLIDTLIRLAIERHEKEKRLKTSRAE
ncbi:MAG TPA: D-alanine--D-alanine ligase family protein [Candidatus Paceibacterota bacterium]|nr:D-alanine--D-alanine ligase family protein [Candidatus Paceibacterota bacterium]